MPRCRRRSGIVVTSPYPPGGVRGPPAGRAPRGAGLPCHGRSAAVARPPRDSWASRRATFGRVTVESEFDHASRVTRLLQILAPEIIFSWTDNDSGVEISPSALLANLGVPSDTEQSPDSFWQRFCQQSPGRPQLEVRPEQPGLVLDPGEDRRLPGSSALFAEQAIAPMAAYCRRRLGAEWWDMPGPFVDASFRGQVIHTALENLYTNATQTGVLPDGLSDNES